MSADKDKPKDEDKEVAKRRDAILKKMLETPPKPKGGKGTSRKPQTPPAKSSK